jgi:glycosyltransferase involved in cell wall biosynthesis
MQTIPIENGHLNPFFSVLTASKNNAETIKETCESIRKQTFISTEHIVMDGASNDDTVGILSELQKSYNLHWASEADGGISEALNKALSLAKGKYIVVIQADDFLFCPETLAHVFRSAAQSKADILSFPVIMTHPQKGNVQRNPIQFLWWNRFKFIFPHQGCFVHRRVFEKIGGFRNEFRINMDYDFFYRALNANSSVAFGDFPVAVMGGEGIGTRKENLPLRLDEEWRVQRLNENSLFWRFAQLSFRALYMPYKILGFQKFFPR